MNCLTENHFKIIYFNNDNKNHLSIYNKNNNKICTICSNGTETYTIWISKWKITFPSNNGVCNYIDYEDNESLCL